jgi:hypothetical protein
VFTVNHSTGFTSLLAAYIPIAEARGSYAAVIKTISLHMKAEE